MNSPAEIPAGGWYWIAEAPGYVSVVAGRLQLAASGDAVRKNVVWPVVPACTLDLRGANWQGITRIDVVSLERNAVYPLSPLDRLELSVPAGRYLTYTVDARGLQAISSIRHCHSPEILPLERPATPPAEVQQLMVHARLPDDVDPAGLVVELHPRSPGSPLASQPPAAAIWVAGRGTFFFLDLPASEPLDLGLHHPHLLTREIELPALPGSVRELPEQALQPRLRLEVPVTYRPAREHARQELTLLHCGAQAKGPVFALDPRQCIPVAEPLPLVPGLGTYAFDHLDLGWYLPLAEIDEERIPGLGSWASYELLEAEPREVRAPPVLLEEFQIFGHLLRADEPVPGEVRLEPLPGSAAPLRRFPTDDELLYHLYYFAQDPLPFARQRLPEKERDRPDAELRGLFYGYQLRACDGEGFCRLFHHYSTLSGAGRLDLDLGAEGELRLQVVDAASQEAIADALVVVREQPPRMQSTFHFVHGEVYTTPDSSAEASGSHTDGDGELRLGLTAGEHRMAVSADGYRRLSLPLTIAGGDRLEVRAELERETPRGGLTFRFPDEKPAARAFLLAFDSGGGPDYRCSQGANGFGEVELPPGCLAERERPFLFLHPQAMIQRFSAAMLEPGGDVPVQPATAPPLRLRLLTTTRELLTSAPLRLRFGDLTLGPNHFLAAASRTGWLMPFTTDAQGVVAVPTSAAEVPLMEVAVLGDETWYPIPPADPNAWIEIVVGE